MIKETINTFAFDPVEFPFNIEVSGITECDEVYITKRSNSYCYILEYILKGSGTLSGTRVFVWITLIFLFSKSIFSNLNEVISDTLNPKRYARSIIA